METLPPVVILVIGYRSDLTSNISKYVNVVSKMSDIMDKTFVTDLDSE